jgi:hypothetical protein
MRYTQAGSEIILNWCVSMRARSPTCGYERKRKSGRTPFLRVGGVLGEGLFVVRMYNQAVPFGFHGELRIYITFKLTFVHSLLCHIFFLSVHERNLDAV